MVTVFYHGPVNPVMPGKHQNFVVYGIPLQGLGSLVLQRLCGSLTVAVVGRAELPSAGGTPPG